METPEIYDQASSEYYYNNDKTSEHNFKVEDLLDFPNDDVVNVVSDHGALDNVTGNSTDTTSSSAVTVVETCNSSFSGNESRVTGDFSDAHFSNDLCFPYDDLAELEWLSNFVEESFSSEDLQKLHLISEKNARSNGSSETRQSPQENNRNSTPIFRSEFSVPGKARSKRSRAAPCSWSSRLSVLSPITTPALSSESESGITSSRTKKQCKAIVFPKKKDVSDNGGGSGGDGRRCLHCATDKTPQWRTGALGPKTLCNACGVRYKSGRLMPEYRPAASPTFVLTKHSNSHRKVLELRRQKEMQKPYHHHQQQQQQYLHHNMMFDVSNGGEDYLNHQHMGPDYRHLI